MQKELKRKMRLEKKRKRREQNNGIVQFGLSLLRWLSFRVWLFLLGLPSLWSSVSGVAQFSVQKPAGHLHKNASTPGMLTQTPPFWHGRSQQLAKVRAQPVPQLAGQASEAGRPHLAEAGEEQAFWAAAPAQHMGVVAQQECW